MIFKHAVEHGLARFFTWLGMLIGRYPLRVIWLSLLTTCIFSLGLLYFEEVNNVRTEYSPINSPSREEYEVAKTFLNQNGTLDPSYVMITAKDKGSLARKEYREKMAFLLNFLQRNLTVMYKGEPWGYQNICEPYCDIVAAFKVFLTAFELDKPTYPTFDYLGARVFIGSNVYGVTLNQEKEVEQFTTVILPFYLVAPYEDSDAIYKWLLEAKKYFKEEEYNILEIGVTGDALVSSEVRRMGMETAPLLTGSVLAMILFVVLSSFRSDPIRAKPWEAVAGCIIPVLALVSSTGIMCFLGLKFQSIIVASLFLVLSVGVDDVFIIMRAWDRTNGPVEERMAGTLEEAGPSITISALTNAAAFFVGMSSSTPAVRSFSLFSAIAICICFLYELIFFSAVLALSGRREAKGKQAILCCLKANPQAHCRVVEALVRIQHFVICWWSKACAWWSIRILLVTTLGFYYYVSVIGIADIHTYISIEKMALPDSYLQNFQGHYENAMRNMQPIQVFVLNPGDLRDEIKLQRVQDLISEYENATHSYGSESTVSWVGQYVEFLEAYNGDPTFVYTEMNKFLTLSAYQHFKSFVKHNGTACDENEPQCISAFFILTNFHNVIKYHELIPVVADWRRIAAKYSDLKVYAYSDHAPFVDQTLTIDSTVWSSVATALACTALACFVFLPDLRCIICAVLSVFSITVGVIGILSLWGLDLDPLSMAALLMAIGFSVDFTAHICYHFYKARHPLVSDRLEECLTSIGMPLVQVGLSTIVALAPLLIKQSYLAIVFLKTVTVVVLLGMIHGLIVLPIVLAFVTSNAVNMDKSPSAVSSELSESSSQKSVERKESFGSQSFRRTKNFLTQSFKRHKIQPIPPEALSSDPALKHKIALGRTPSATM